MIPIAKIGDQQRTGSEREGKNFSSLTTTHFFVRLCTFFHGHSVNLLSSSLSHLPSLSLAIEREKNPLDLLAPFSNSRRKERDAKRRRKVAEKQEKTLFRQLTDSVAFVRMCEFSFSLSEKKRRGRKVGEKKEKGEKLVGPPVVVCVMLQSEPTTTAISACYTVIS